MRADVRPRATRGSALAAFLVLALLIGIIHGTVVGAGWPDREAAPLLREGSAAAEWSPRGAAPWIPLGATVRRVEALLASGDAMRGAAPPILPFRLEAGFLHLAAVLALYAALRRVGFDGFAAAAGAAVLAIHPVAVESMADPLRVPDRLATALGLAAVAVSVGRGRGGTGPRRSGAALVLYGLAALAHPRAVVFPLVALGLAAGPGRRPVAAAGRGLAPAGLLVFVIAAVGGLAGAEAGTLPGARLGLALDALAFGIGRLLVPVVSAPSYAAAEARLAATAWPWTGLIVVAGGVLALRVREARAPLALLAAGLLPAVGIALAGGTAADALADRQAIAALAGPALAVAALAARWPGAVRRTSLVVALAVLAWLGRDQAAAWRDPVSIATRIVAVSPGSYEAHVRLGDDLARAGRLPEAIAAYDGGIRRAPERWEARLGRGVAWTTLARADSALVTFEEAVRVAPDVAILRIHLADMLMANGREPEARGQIREAYRLDPDDPMMAYNLAMMLIATGEWAEAESVLAESDRRQPGHPGIRRTLERLRAGRAAVEGGAPGEPDPAGPGPAEASGP